MKFLERLEPILGHPFTKWLRVRLRQQSTWRGLAAVLATFGIVIAPEKVDLIFTTVIGVLGLIAMVRDDLKAAEKSKGVDVE